MLSNLFLAPPTILPSDYLSETEARKVAGVRLSSPPGAWSDEVIQTLLSDHPYIPADRLTVTFKQKDDQMGSAFGFLSIMGAPRVSIPIIIHNRELKPLDVMIVRGAGQNDSQNAGNTEGVGDMQDDQVRPLTEMNFMSALDSGEPGEMTPESKIRGAGWTEDGSALRLPYRGRTVLAHAMGITEAQKAEVGKIIKADKTAAAGFYVNGTQEVLEAWMNAEAPKSSVQAKLASAEIKMATAAVPVDLPVEIEMSKFTAGHVLVDDATAKTAAVLETVDLFNPEAGAVPYLAFEDGSFCVAPEKVACLQFTDGDDALTAKIADKLTTGSLRRGGTVSFLADDVFTAPATLHKIATHEGNGSIVAIMTDGLRQTEVVLSGVVKTATRSPDGSWMLPMSTRVLAFNGPADNKPMAMDKVASYIKTQLPDCLTVAGGQWTLSIGGQPFGLSQADEEKAAAVLTTHFTNGREMLELVKQGAAQKDGAASLRFSSDLKEALLSQEKQAAAYLDTPKRAREAIAGVAIPLDKALKLAAGIGDPQAADAVLGAGFLNEDNVSEFVQLHSEFDDAVQKLARLLLAVRMGFPGDENATAVAMKSLQRVSDELRSARAEAQ